MKREPEKHYEKINRIKFFAEKQEILSKEFGKIRASIWLDFDNPDHVEISKCMDRVMGFIETKMLE